MALSMRCWVPKEKFVRGIIARMYDGDGEGDGMGVVFHRVHESADAGVNFQYTLTFVAGEMGFDSIAFLASDPFGLGESTSCGGIAAFEPVAVGIAGVGAGFYFSVAFYVCRYVELDLDKFEVVDPTKAGIEIDHLNAVFEVWRTSAR